MKKIISCVLIINILLSIFLPTFSHSYNDTSKSVMSNMTTDYNTYKEDSENGKSTVGGNGEKGYEISEGTTNSILKNLIKIFNIIPTFTKLLMDAVTYDSDATEINRDYGKAFSIQKLVFNKIELFDINFFEYSDEDSDLMASLKEQIAKGYYMLRDIAIVAMLVILVYTGVRMAIATIAETKAKYKKMLMSWGTAFATLMLLPYIMVAVLTLSQTIMGLFENIMVNICGGEIKTLEEDLLGSLTTSTAKGFSIIIPAITYWIIVFYQAKFFYMYAKRMFSTAFLIVISPLVLAQHAFDKVADGKAGAFKGWLTEFALNVAIQPIHAMIYMVFMAMASNIVSTAPILSIIFLTAISRGERVVRNMLNIKNSTTVQSMSDNFKAKDVMNKVGSMGH